MSNINYVFQTTNVSSNNLLPWKANYKKKKMILPKEFMISSQLSMKPSDQKKCGSCWAFASVAALSDRINIICNKRIINNMLSPEVLISCNNILDLISSPEAIQYPKGYDVLISELNKIPEQYGCHGNSLISACLFLHVWGTFRSECAPYELIFEKSGYDHFNFGYRSVNQFRIKNETNVCSKYYGNLGLALNTTNCQNRIIDDNHIYFEPAQLYRSFITYQIGDFTERDIMMDLLEWGTVATYFTVYSDFYDYDVQKDGVYIHNEENNIYEGSHAVCIVGWGTYKNIPFWWIKNSWGTQYGLNGYFRILRGKNHCKIEENVIGMIPNFYPQSDIEIDKGIHILEKHYYFEKQISPLYFKFYERILIIYSLIDQKLVKQLITQQLLQKYPIIDYFFFHITYPMTHSVYPANGYTRFTLCNYVGLDYSPPFTIKDVKKWQSFL